MEKGKQKRRLLYLMNRRNVCGLNHNKSTSNERMQYYYNYNNTPLFEVFDIYFMYFYPPLLPYSTYIFVLYMLHFCSSFIYILFTEVLPFNLFRSFSFCLLLYNISKFSNLTSFNISIYICIKFEILHPFYTTGIL